MLMLFIYGLYLILSCVVLSQNAKPGANTASLEKYRDQLMAEKRQLLDERKAVAAGEQMIWICKHITTRHINVTFASATKCYFHVRKFGTSIYYQVQAIASGCQIHHTLHEASAYAARRLRFPNGIEIQPLHCG